MASNPELIEMVSDLANTFADGPESLIDLLCTIQMQLGYIPPSTVPLIAEKTGLLRPEVYRAIEMAPSLSLAASGQHKMYICNADNCCMQGGTELMQFAEQHLGIKAFQTTADQKIRLESFQCLGNCSMSPNVMIDGRIYGLMDETQLAKMIDNLNCGLEPLA